MTTNGTDSVLPAEARARLVEHLRTGLGPEEAAARTGITLDALHAAANTDGTVAIALAGRDPYTRKATMMQQRADVLRGVALGLSLTDAARSAGVTAHTVIAWTAKDERFETALDAVGALADCNAAKQGTRMTPARATAFLDALREGETTARAAERAGISPRTVYYYRDRDPRFAEQLKEAQAAGRSVQVRRRGKKRSTREAHYRLVPMDSTARQQP